jgi:hypothetical protein
MHKALQLRKTHERGNWYSFVPARAVAIACVLLLAMLVLVQVAHVHPLSADADHCPICVVMHSAAPVAEVTAAVISAPTSSPVPIPVVHSVVRPWHCTLFNRPPPTQA